MITHTTELHARADISVLELHIQFQNRFEIEWDGLGKNELTPFQFNLSYTPFVNNWAKLSGGREYHTFDVHFTKEYLNRLAPEFPQLGRFIEKAEKRAPVNLSEIDHFLTPQMITIVNHILTCSFTNNAKKFYIESKVMELLILALERITGEDTRAPIKLSPYDVECLHEARKIILSDFENRISLLQLARKVGINDFKLKKGFKHLFGTTVFDCQQIARMEKAKELVKDNSLSREEIAFLTGYNNASSFITAFKKHFGFPPGHLLK
jgi:AraC-like DNA-binding protein